MAKDNEITYHFLRIYKGSLEQIENNDVNNKSRLIVKP